MINSLGSYMWWVPTVVMLCILSGYCAYRNSTTGGLIWPVLITVVGILFGITYSMITKYSTRLMLDNLIYNAIITVVVTGVFVYYGFSRAFSWTHWLGICTIIFGIILFKWR